MGKAGERVGDGLPEAVMAGVAEGRSHRRIAEDLWGAEAVAREWAPESWMRAQLRRRVRKAKALLHGGWRDQVPKGPGSA